MPPKSHGKSLTNLSHGVRGKCELGIYNVSALSMEAIVCLINLFQTNNFVSALSMEAIVCLINLFQTNNFCFTVCMHYCFRHILQTSWRGRVKKCLLPWSSFHQFMLLRHRRLFWFAHAYLSEMTTYQQILVWEISFGKTTVGHPHYH